MRIEERIPITILGQTYEIIGNPADTLYYSSLAQYVESKMKEIQNATNIVSIPKIAILTALNICDELFRERDQKSSAGKSNEKKHEELIRLLDTILQNPAEPKTIAPTPTVTKAEEPEKEPVFNLETGD